VDGGTAALLHVGRIKRPGRVHSPAAPRRAGPGRRLLRAPPVGRYVLSGRRPDPNRPSPIERAKIEVGWVPVGPFDEADRRATKQAHRRMSAYLREHFSEFDWQFPTAPPRALDAAADDDGGRAEPVALIDHGVAERDARRWDFALVVTPADLHSYFKPYALGVPSQAMQVATLSTARLGPEPPSSLSDEPPDGDDPDRPDVLGRRLGVLAMHLFGHLGDLDHSGDAADFMFAPRAVADLDGMRGYDYEAQERLRTELRDVADVRLEETGRYRHQRALFYLRATWQQRSDILGAVAETQPWAFPLRFSRLTTAAVSTMIVLLTAAEGWELSMSQPPGRVVLLTIGALGGTSAYLLKRQHLLARRRAPRLSEQRVKAVLSVTATVGVGMATTYALLFVVTLALSLFFFSDALVTGWVASVTEGGAALGWGHYFSLAGFVAALGLAIGALGASFEEEGYFRHVAFADEET